MKFSFSLDRLLPITFSTEVRSCRSVSEGCSKDTTPPTYMSGELSATPPPSSCFGRKAHTLSLRIALRTWLRVCVCELSGTPILSESEKGYSEREGGWKGTGVGVGNRDANFTARNENEKGVSLSLLVCRFGVYGDGESMRMG